MDQKELERYWSARYEDGSTGWDLGEVAPPLKAYIDQLDDKELRILIPGAGNAYEAEYLFRAGFENVYVMDISEIPLLQLKARSPEFPDEQLLQADFFAHQGTFDLIIEQTFFCSFPPVDDTRERYARKMYDLLRPQGKLVGLWFDFPFSGDLTKRPFGCEYPEYQNLFSPYFHMRTFERSYNSIPERAGKELFGILQKKE